MVFAGGMLYFGLDFVNNLLSYQVRVFLLNSVTFLLSLVDFWKFATLNANRYCFCLIVWYVSIFYGDWYPSCISFGHEWTPPPPTSALLP